MATLSKRALNNLKTKTGKYSTYTTKKSLEYEVLSKEDSKVIIEALLNPPEPSAALIAAFKRYKKNYED